MDKKSKESFKKLAQEGANPARIHNENHENDRNRTEYQHDWERVIHCKAFRRLEDKAQIYTLAKGDHFRTRLTHTLEVTQIARGIARELQLNEDLVEAIALAHDLGHTPFGHVGERTLHEILKEEGVKGGFKHNFQGVKVVSYLEEKYINFEGINLTYHVIEGILKHTKICNCINSKDCNKKMVNCGENEYDIGEFLYEGDKAKLHLEYSFATTLEGQVVAIADEIAQRAHDLDDGIAGRIIDEEKFLKQLKNESSNNKIFNDIYEKIEKTLGEIANRENDYIDISDLKRANIIKEIITYFIKEVVNCSKEKIKNYEKDMNENCSEICITKKLIDFSHNAKKVRGKLEEITSNKIINSEEVNCFDGKGKYIITKLYEAYKNNPMQMPDTALNRICREFCIRTDDKAIDIRGNRKSINEEFIRLKGQIKKHKEELKKENIDSDNLADELDIKKYNIFIRGIVDFIAGMTDDFANRQFEKLYSPRTY